MNTITASSSNSSTVQGTNDSSILSKHAMCHMQYMCDEFIDVFTSKTSPRRTPLINRGYYIRMKAIDTIIRDFLTVEGPKQIVSVGAGFDTLFFRLHGDKTLKSQAEQTYIVEIDFEEVALRKRCLMLNNAKTSKFLRGCHVCESGSIVKLSSQLYCLIGADLSKTADLRHAWDHETLLLTDLPTLVLSECVMTYMDHHLSTKLIQDIRTYFSDSMFVTYEQVKPWDAFGRFMRSHFDKLNSSLKAITTYETVAHQQARYKRCGYKKVNVFTMNQFYQSLSTAEKERIANLEYFDEHEEWRMKCDHYVVIIARESGRFQGIEQLVRATEVSSRKSSESTKNFPISPHSAPVVPVSVAGLELYAHASASFEHCGVTYLLIHGGFGVLQNGRHGRRNEMTLLEMRETGENLVAASMVTSRQVSCRLHHTLTPLSGGRVFVFGGRLSPSTALTSPLMVFVEAASQSLYMEELSPTGPAITPRWRHTATSYTRDGEDFVLITGGLTHTEDSSKKNQMLVQCIIYNITRNTTATGPRLPVPLHSHDACYDGHQFVYLVGGMTPDGSVSDRCYRLDVSCSDLSWELCNFSLGDIFSHGIIYCHGYLVSVGGIDGVGRQVNIRTVNVNSLQYQEILLPVMVKNGFLMYFNNSVHVISSSERSSYLVIVGGGGNCFSFGTHINNSLVVISLGSICRH